MNRMLLLAISAINVAVLSFAVMVYVEPGKSSGRLEDLVSSGRFESYSLVSASKLISNPELYNNKNLSIQGYIACPSGQCSIFSSRDDFWAGVTANSVRVEGSQGAIGEWSGTRSFGYVTMYATFRRGVVSYDDLGRPGRVYDVKYISGELPKYDINRGLIFWEIVQNKVIIIVLSIQVFNAIGLVFIAAAYERRR